MRMTYVVATGDDALLSFEDRADAEAYAAGRARADVLAVPLVSRWEWPDEQRRGGADKAE